LKGTVNIFIVYPSLIELSIYRSIFILFFILLFYSYLYFMYSLYDIDINKQNKIINIKKKKKKNIKKKKKIILLIIVIIKKKLIHECRIEL